MLCRKDGGYGKPQVFVPHVFKGRGDKTHKRAKLFRIGKDQQWIFGTPSLEEENSLEGPQGKGAGSKAVDRVRGVKCHPLVLQDPEKGFQGPFFIFS